MTIEERKASDPQLAALLSAAFTELVHSYGAVGRSPVDPRARYLVAVLDGQPRACGALQRTDHRGVGEIKRMYTTVQARGKGLATEVLNGLEHLGRVNGFVRLRLATGTRQPEAIALYEKNGWTITEPYEKYVGDAESVCFSKPL